MEVDAFMEKPVDYQKYKEDLINLIQETDAALAKVKSLRKRLNDSLVKTGLADNYDISDLQNVLNALISSSNTVLETFSGLVDQRYFMEGGYMKDLCDQLTKKGFEVEGSSPIEIFPVTIQVEGKEQTVSVKINNKEYGNIDPDKVALEVAKRQESLRKKKADPSKIASRLEWAYDILPSKTSKAAKAKNLLDLYDMLAHDSRAKEGYTQVAFRLDVAKLYEEKDSVELKSGRTIRFGTGRDAKKAIRIVGSDGMEHLVSTIEFLDKE